MCGWTTRLAAALALLLLCALSPSRADAPCRWEVSPSTLQASPFPDAPHCSLIQVVLSRPPVGGGGDTLTPLHVQHRVRGALLLLTTEPATLAPGNASSYFHAVAIKLLYAKLFRYTLYVYHGRAAALPPELGPCFHKIPAIEAVLRLGEPFVLYSDLDTLMLPSTAWPVHTIVSRPLTLQAESSLCADVLLFAHHPLSFAFLRDWWQVGVKSKCCAFHPYDQIALKYTLGVWLSNFTREPVHTQRSFVELLTGREPSAQAAFLAVDAPFVTFYGGAARITRALAPPQVQLHSCLGLWGGCISPQQPALLYHTGGSAWHGLTSRESLQELLDWWLDAFYRRAAPRAART